MNSLFNINALRKSFTQPALHRYFNTYSFHLRSNKTRGRSREEHIKDCYATLNIHEDCTNDEIRDAYLGLAKKYHPDSGADTANHQAFSSISQAYTTLIKHRQRVGKLEEEEAASMENVDIRHTAPQHRQYLSYEGVGIGNPSIREKQYRSFKAARAQENVYEYKINKHVAQHENALTAKAKKQAKEQMIRGGMDRLVEDLIRESMEKGDFDNLPGSGKPLPHVMYNPYVDTTTHNINKVLIQNGYVPEWVQIERDIRENLSRAKQKLDEGRFKAGPEPFSTGAKLTWNKTVEKFNDDISLINVKINKLNLIVPSLHQQLVPYSKQHVENEVLQAMESYRARGNHNVTKYKPPIAVYGTQKGDNVKFSDVWKELKALFRSS